MTSCNIKSSNFHGRLNKYLSWYCSNQRSRSEEEVGQATAAKEIWASHRCPHTEVARDLPGENLNDTNVEFLFVNANVPQAVFVVVLTWQFYSERTSSWPRLRKLREVRTRARWLRGLQEETRWHLFLVSNCQWQVHNWSFCDKHSFHLAWGRGLPRALSVTMASWWFCNWEEEERKKMHLQVVD